MEKFTKKAIISAFMELLSKKSLDKITVKDIVDKCGINRNTFYYYYQDIYDLIDSIFQEETKNVRDVETGEDFFDEMKRKVGLAIEYRQALSHIYNSRSRNVIVKYLRVSSDDFVSKYICNKAKDYNVSESDLNLIIDCYSSALCVVLLEWIGGNDKSVLGLDGDEFMRKITKLYESTIHVALEAFSARTKKT